MIADVRVPGAEDRDLVRLPGAEVLVADVRARRDDALGEDLVLDRDRAAEFALDLGGALGAGAELSEVTVDDDARSPQTLPRAVRDGLRAS